MWQRGRKIDAISIVTGLAVAKDNRQALTLEQPGLC